MKKSGLRKRVPSSHRKPKAGNFVIEISERFPPVEPANIKTKTMNTIIPINRPLMLVLGLVFSVMVFNSCTTAYQTGQTPDDVYYSPLRPAIGSNDDDDDMSRAREERRIRMGVNNPRYRFMDNTIGFGGFDPFFPGWNTWNANPFFNYGWNSWGYNPFNMYHPVYNPFPVFVVAPPRNSTPRVTNLSGYGGSYNNGNINNSIKYGGQRPSRGYNNSNYRGRGYDGGESSSGRSYQSGGSSSPSRGTMSSGGSRPSRNGN